MTQGLTSLALLLVVSFILSTSHAALSNVSRQTLRDRAENGNKRVALALSIAEDSTQVLRTFQLANIIVRFLIAGLVALLVLPPLAALMGGGLGTGAWLNAVLYVVLLPVAGLTVFIVTELIPGVLTLRDSVGWAVALAPIARVVITLLRPLVAVMTSLRRVIAGPVGGSLDSAFVTEEAIKTLIDAGQEEGSIDVGEKEMIYSILELDETMAREIMVPRIDVIAVELHTPLHEALEVIIEAGHSRIPVYEESLDHIKGMLYAKDLLEVWHRGKDSVDLSSIMREAQFVPETKRVSDLLRELQAAAVHLAIVIDEYGGTAGLVTIEDIVEEIVGEIIDEYDTDEEAPYEAVGENEYIVDARLDLDDLIRLMNIDIPDEQSDTLGGFILGRLGKVPDAGESIVTDGLSMEVINVENQRIGKVRVTRTPPTSLSEQTPDRQVKNGTHR